MILARSVECLGFIDKTSQECASSGFCGDELLGQNLLCQAIAEIVVKTFDIPADGFWGCTRGVAPVALGRQISMYLAHVVCGLSFTQIGIVFERDRTTVSHACCVVEDLRDDRGIDNGLDDLERSILCLLDTGLYLNKKNGGESGCE